MKVLAIVLATVVLSSASILYPGLDQTGFTKSGIYGSRLGSILAQNDISGRYGLKSWSGLTDLTGDHVYGPRVADILGENDITGVYGVDPMYRNSLVSGVWPFKVDHYGDYLRSFNSGKLGINTIVPFTSELAEELVQVPYVPIETILGHKYIVPKTGVFASRTSPLWLAKLAEEDMIVKQHIVDALSSGVLEREVFSGLEGRVFPLWLAELVQKNHIVRQHIVESLLFGVLQREILSPFHQGVSGIEGFESRTLPLWLAEVVLKHGVVGQKIIEALLSGAHIQEGFTGYPMWLDKIIREHAIVGQQILEQKRISGIYPSYQQEQFSRFSPLGRIFEGHTSPMLLSKLAREQEIVGQDYVDAALSRYIQKEGFTGYSPIARRFSGLPIRNTLLDRSYAGVRTVPSFTGSMNAIPRVTIPVV